MRSTVLTLLVISDAGSTAVIESALMAANKAFRLLIADQLSVAFTQLNANIDLVLLDIAFWKDSNLEAISRLHTLAPYIPIVLLVSRNSENIAAAAIQMGAKDYLVKEDINSSYLLHVINLMIEKTNIQEVLRENEQHLTLVMKAAQIGGYEWDIFSNELIGREQFAKLLGWNEGNPIRTMEEFTRQVHPDDLEGFHQAIQAALNGDEQLSMEYRVVWPNGEIHWLSEQGRTFKDASGCPAKRFGAITDITQRKQNEELLLQQTVELKRSNQELEQFAYIASHDLQEPLRIISSYTQLLQRRYQDQFDQNAQEFMAFIVDGAQRMQRLIDDLLLYTRVERRSKDFVLTSSSEAVHQALVKLKSQIQEQKATVTVDALPEVTADPGQLVQLFQNLISNAIKFHQQGEAPSVHVSVTESCHDWTFSVTDHGIGIEPQFFERIFVIFQRLHGKLEYPGSGIGLALCKKIVERHGGKIWVDSVPGQGATFNFSIPKGRTTHA